MNAFVFADVLGNLPFEKEDMTVIKLNYWLCSVTQNMLDTEPDSRVHVQECTFLWRKVARGVFDMPW